MLVLTRKAKEEIRIGNDITVTIVRVKGQSVRIGINAPSHVHIMRSELGNKKDESEKTELPNGSTARKSKPSGSTGDGDSPETVIADLASNSPVLKRLENQLGNRPQIDTAKKDSSPEKRFQSPLGSTDSFSRVFGRERLNRAHRMIDDSDASELG